MKAYYLSSRRGLIVSLIVSMIPFLWFFTTANQANSADTKNFLKLEAYLQQVRTQHLGFSGAYETSLASQQRASEAELLTAPQLFVSAQFASDAKPSNFPSFTYDQINTHLYSLSISQQTHFGLSGKISFSATYLNYLNPAMAGLSMSSALPAAFDTKPSIDLNFPLWSGGFGKSIQANQNLAEASALASSYGSRYQARATLMEAEAIYWRLALARQAQIVQNEALARAQKIYDWNARRVKLHLADDSDALQAQALLEVRQLEQELSKDELHNASIAFNSLRNLDSPEVPETLLEISSEMNEWIKKLEPPQRAPLRDDVRAAQESERIAQNNATLGIERNKPALNVFASYALNGHQENFGSALGDPFSANRPTLAMGVNFSMPLDFQSTQSARQGWIAEQTAAEKTYQRKLFEQEIGWKNLLDHLNDAKKKLELAEKLEKTQRRKLEHERDRLQRGRTVTYQVLMFEQDFAQSQLNRIRAQAEVLNIIAQMKLYSNESPTGVSP